MPAIDPPFEFQDPTNDNVVVVCCNILNDEVGLGLFVLNGPDIDLTLTKLDLISFVETLSDIDEKKDAVVMKFPDIGDGPSVARLSAEEESVTVILTVPERSLSFSIGKADIIGFVEFLQPAL